MKTDHFDTGRTIIFITVMLRNGITLEAEYSIKKRLLDIVMLVKNMVRLE